MATRKVEKRTLPSGLVTYRAPYVDAAGNRRSQNFPTAKEAKAFLLTVGNELRQGVHTPTSTSPTVGEVAEMWIAHCERRQLEPMTILNYRAHIDLHIAPFLGETKLSAVTPTTVHTFTDQLHEAGRSADMIRRVVVSWAASSRKPGAGGWSPRCQRWASTSERPVATTRARQFPGRSNCAR
jgi:integrase